MKIESKNEISWKDWKISKKKIHEDFYFVNLSDMHFLAFQGYFDSNEHCDYSIVFEIHTHTLTAILLLKVLGDFCSF